MVSDVMEEIICFHSGEGFGYDEVFYICVGREKGPLIGHSTLGNFESASVEILASQWCLLTRKMSFHCLSSLDAILASSTLETTGA